MKILFLTHDVPSPEFSDTGPIFHIIKNLKSNHGHDITLLSFDSERTKKSDLEEINKYCEKIKFVKFKINNSKFSDIIKTLKNNILNLKTNIRLGLYFNLLDYYYSSEMKNSVENELNNSYYDLVYVSRPMGMYSVNKSIIKIIHPYDAVYEWHRQVLSVSKGLNKLFSWISVFLTKNYESKIYKKYDLTIVVAENDKLLLKSLNSEIKLYLLPNGVDTEFFRPSQIKEDFPSIIFVSDMSGSPTTDNVNYFYNHIYPIIKNEFPKIKLYLVGRNPASEIIKLSKDPSVLVTGYVDDVRPYINRSSVFVAPMILGTGIKNKVLEAMSMSKAVVTTSVGIQGITALHNSSVMITDDPKDFANYVTNILKDSEKKKKLGHNARKKIVKEYSWEKTIKSLNKEITRLKEAN